MCPKDRGGYARTWRSVGQPNLFQISERGEAAAQVLQSAEGPLSSEQKEFPRFSTDAWVPFVQTDCHSSLACGFRVDFLSIICSRFHFKTSTIHIFSVSKIADPVERRKLLPLAMVWFAGDDLWWVMQRGKGEPGVRDGNRALRSARRRQSHHVCVCNS